VYFVIFPGINQVTLLGRAGQDPQLRGTEEHAVTIFPLATSFTLKSPEGLNWSLLWTYYNITSGHSKATLPPHTDGSVIFARWRQCAPHLIHGSLNPPNSESQTTSRSVQSFCTAHGRKSHMLYNGLSFPPSKLLLRMGISPSSNVWLLGPTRVHIPDSISISSDVFAQLTIMTDSPTEYRQTLLFRL